MKMSRSSLEAAAEAAARVNAMLIAKGKLKLPPTQIKPKIGGCSLGRSLVGDLITAEVDINDAPLSARNLLTRGHIQDEICKYSGAALSTRGRYMTLEERQNISTSDCRPLYLHVQASNQESVALAVKRIQDIINQHVIASGGIKSPTAGVVTYPSSNTNGTTVPSMLTATSPPLSSGPHFIQDKVFVGLEQAPPTYPVRDKILGPGGSFLQHIRTETGANVTLRGKGSGFIEPTSGREAFEPLYIHVTHPKLDGLQQAKVLAINLVETAHVEFAQWQQQQQSVLQPIMPVVIPQQTPLAYQNQVVVAPTQVVSMLPVSAAALASAPNIVSAGIPMSASSVPAAALNASVSRLVQTPVSLSSVPPVSVVTSIPVSVQGIPSQTVITYPTTYVASHNSVLARAPPSIMSNIISVAPRLPVSASYSVATSQALVSSQHTPLSLAQYPAPIQTFTLSQPLTYTTVPASQAHLTQQVIPHSSVLIAPNAVSYTAVPPPYVSNQPAGCPASVAPMTVVQGVSTTYSHIHYPRVDVDATKRRFYEEQQLNKCRIQDSMLSLQESNSNHPTDIGAQPTTSPAGTSMPGSQDRDLMPPPHKFLNKEALGMTGPFKSCESDEPERKKLKGALIGIASIYGSDDSSDDESPATSDSSSYSKRYVSSRSNKPLM